MWPGEYFCSNDHCADLRVLVQPIPNGRPFKYLHEEVSMLEKTYGIRVSFCRVDKEFNEPAAALAREAVKRL